MLNLPEMNLAEQMAFERSITFTSQRKELWLSNVSQKTYIGIGEVTLISPVMSDNKLVLQMDSNIHIIPVTKVLVFSSSCRSDSGHIVLKDDNDDKSVQILTWGKSSIGETPVKIAEAVRKEHSELFQ